MLSIICQWALVFFSVFLYDTLYACYIQQVQEKNAFKSTITSSLLYLCGAYVVVSYVNNMWLMIPALIGGALGNYITVKHSQSKKEK